MRRLAVALALVGIGAGGLAAAAWLGLVPGVQLRGRAAPLPSEDLTGAPPSQDSAPVPADSPPERPAAAPAADSAPAAADDAPTVAAADSVGGEATYRGVGRCAGCHGAMGEGVAGLGPSLRDDAWLHGGSRAAIRQVVTEGAAPPLGGYSVAMPAYGGQLTPERVAQLAAYVWTLSHPGMVSGDSTVIRPTVPQVAPVPAPRVPRPTVPLP